MRAAILLRTLLVLFLLLVGFGAGCASSVPATITRYSPVPFNKNAGILVLAQRQRERVVESLREAGLNVADAPTRDGVSLKVLVGSARAGRNCGTVNNVAYVLSGAGQRLVIKGRGATGTCEPNIFDEMSHLLATQAAKE